MRGVRGGCLDGRASKMIIGEERAVGWALAAARRFCPSHATTVPASRCSGIREPPEAGEERSGAATPTISNGSFRALRLRTGQGELGVDPLARPRGAFHWRTRSQITGGLPGFWVEDDTIVFAPCFGVDARGRPAAAGLVDPPVRGDGDMARADARPLPAAARDDPDRDALRPHRERPGKCTLRVDRCTSSAATALCSSEVERAILARTGTKASSTCWTSRTATATSRAG